MERPTNKKTKLEILKSDEESKYKLKILPLTIKLIDENPINISLIAVQEKDEHFLHVSSILSCCILDRYSLGKKASSYDITIENLETLQYYKHQNMSPFVSASDISLLGDIIVKKDKEMNKDEQEIAKLIWKKIKKIYSDEDNKKLPELIPFRCNNDVPSIPLDITNERIELMRELDHQYKLMRSMLFKSPFSEEDLKNQLKNITKTFKKTEFKIFEKTNL